MIPIWMTSWPPTILGSVVNKPFIDYYACMENGCYLGSAYYYQQKT